MEIYWRLLYYFADKKVALNLPGYWRAQPIFAIFYFRIEQAIWFGKF